VSGRVIEIKLAFGTENRFGRAPETGVADGRVTGTPMHAKR